jgi:hypothetical protein
VTPVRLLLLSRPGCCLCDELEDELIAEFGPRAFAIERADVDSRPEWRERYGLLIPVLLDNSGQVRSQTRLQAELLAPLLPPSGP